MSSPSTWSFNHQVMVMGGGGEVIQCHCITSYTPFSPPSIILLLVSMDTTVFYFIIRPFTPSPITPPSLP